jgi:hypothetical protein
MELITQERDGLAAVKVPRSLWDDGDDDRQGFAKEQQPLFADKEIMDELYTPLVRELVLPENFVPARYSATQHMIDGSNEHYIKASRSKPRTVESGGIKLTQAAISVGASVAKAVLQTTTNLVDVDGVVTRANTSDVGLSLDQQVQYGAIADGIALVLSAGVGVISEAVDSSRGKPFKQSTWQIIANNAALGVGTAVTGLTNNIEIGLAVVDAVSGGIGAIAMATHVATWSSKGGDFPAHEVLQDAAAAVSSSLKAVSDPTQGDFSKEFADFSVSFGAALNAWAMACTPKVQAAFRTGKWRDVLPEVMLEIAKEAGIAAASAVADHRVTDAEMADAGLHTEAQTFERGMVQEHAVLWGASAFEKTTHAVAKAARPSKPKHVNETKAAVEALVKSGLSQTEAVAQVFAQEAGALADQQAQVAQAVEELEQDKVNYTSSLERLTETDPSDNDYKSIAKLTDQLKRDHAVVDAAFNLVQMGLAIGDSVGPLVDSRSDMAKPLQPVIGASVSIRFYGPIMGASELVKCVRNLYAIVQRLIALRAWMNSRKMAIGAVSPLATSVQNFIKNNRVQCSQAAIQAVLKLASTISNFSEAVHPIMRVATLGLEVVNSAEEALFQIYKQRQLVGAWKLTKQALDNPKNRKLGLIVRGMNPTLAKYTIAYGALVEKDQVAIAALNQVGLDRETLMRPSSKVADVQTYLQALYRDDNVIYVATDAEPGKTSVPAPALTVRAWSMSHMLWSERDGLAGDNPPHIVTGLAKVEKFAVTTDFGTRIEEIDRYANALEQLEADFRSMVPMTALGRVIKSVHDAVGLYADLAGAQYALVREALGEDLRLNMSGGEASRRFAAEAPRDMGLSLRPISTEEEDSSDDGESVIEPTPCSPI